MARYLDRLRSTPAAPSSLPMSLAKQLASRRNLRVAPKPTSSPKPSLTTSRQKEGELKKTLETPYMPSGLKLARLRQLAAQHKILGEQSRDFLHRSEAGKKLEGKDALQKFETELLKAEQEVAAAEHLERKVKYEFRRSDHSLKEKAKELTKELYHDAAQEQHHAQTAQQHLLEQRQARLAALHAITDRQAPAPASAVAPAHPAHSFIEPMPLTTAPSTPGRAAGFVGGGHITAPTTPIQPGAIPAEPVAEPTPAPTTEPAVPEPGPAPEVSLPDTSHLSDPFGGDS